MHMNSNSFSEWKNWKKRNEFHDLRYPGIYIISYTKEDLTDKRFSWLPEIIYIGMSNSKNGLYGRLEQFDKTMTGKANKHGGADRVKYQYNDYNNFSENAYVSILTVPCNPKNLDPDELVKMSDVPKYEYLCWAEYLRRFKALPQFNKRSALKFSSENRNLSQPLPTN